VDSEFIRKSLAAIQLIANSSLCAYSTQGGPAFHRKAGQRFTHAGLMLA
jgi:hypothetical protein